MLIKNPRIFNGFLLKEWYFSLVLFAVSACELIPVKLNNQPFQ
jgi:hypothetical protein